MKLCFKTVCVAVVSFGAAFSTVAQINLKSNNITFRDSLNGRTTTIHYGDLKLHGGIGGTNYGWLYCNRVWSSNKGRFDGLIEANAGINVYGGLNVLSGTKNFIHPHPTDTDKVIKYIAVEAGEAMTMVRGISKTNGGTVIVTLPEHFSLVTSSDAPLTVLLTPEKAPVLLYVAEKSKERITVVMKPADFKEFGDAEFAWQVSGVRDGYENEKIICDADSLLSGNEGNKQVSDKRAKIDERSMKLMEKIREKEKSKKK